MKHTLISILLIIVAIPCAAQWHSIDIGGQVGAFGVRDSFLFIGSANHVYRYTVAHGYGYADAGIDFTQGSVTSFASLGRYFFAGITHSNGTNGPVFISTNNGASWSHGTTAGPIAANGTYLFATYGAPDQIIFSSDSGINWNPVLNQSVSSFATNGTYIYAATSTGLWRSTNSGTDWYPDTTPIGSLNSIAFLGTLMFGSNGTLALTATPGPIVKSTDSGSHWTEITLPGRIITQLVSDSTYLFAGTDRGVFISLDSGGHWRSVNDGLGKFLEVNALGLFDTLLFVNSTDTTNLGQWFTASRSIRAMVDTTQSSVVATPQPDDTLSIYPNPASGLVTILAGGTSILGVQLLNMLGESMIDLAKPYSSVITLDVSTLASGTYFMRIQTLSGTALKKITIER